jgi:sRNA-binding regulator protein Hfq
MKVWNAWNAPPAGEEVALLYSRLDCGHERHRGIARALCTMRACRSVLHKEIPTPSAVKLMDGQIFQGWIEYYDRNMVRLTRHGAPNLFIFKHEIMYIAEDGARKK